MKTSAFYPASASSWRSQGWPVLATAIALMLVWAGLAYHLQSRRTVIREQTHRDVLNLSIGVEKHVERLLAGVDQVMRFVAEDVRDDPETFDFVAWSRRSTSLEDVATQMALFNEVGELVASRTPPAPGTPRFNIRDRDYFLALQASAERGLYVDRTLKGRITGKDVLQTARRLSDRDGTFAGVIVTSIDADYLSRQFKAIDVGAHGSIGLFGHDGYIRARYPQAEGMYEQNVNSLSTGKGVFDHLKEKPAGTYEVESAFDHVTRVFGYRTVGSLPLIVTVGKSLDEVMIPFQAERRIAVTTGVGITALLLAFLVFQLRTRRRDHRHAAALADANRTLFDKERAARTAETRYRVLAENTSELIMLGHDDGSRSYISPAVKRLLGYTPEELGAMRLRDYVHPDDLADLYATTRRLASGQDEVSAVYRSRRKDGSWIWVEGVFRRIPDASRDEPSIVATFRDVSERQAYAQHLEEARATAIRIGEEAEQASRAKTDFLASMSHEIRTPLNGIIGFTGLILDRQELDDGLRRQVQLIQSSGSALLTVVNDVLDFSKIEADQIEIVPQPFAPAALVDNVISMTRGLAEPKGLLIHANLDPTLPATLLGDADRLRQVLLNLLNNAIKFTARGTVSLDVTCVPADAEAVTLRMAIQDTGIGIPADKLGRLFQRFSQVDGSVQREFGGTGLGLAISKRLVELMGGIIGVESTPGRGSTFWLEITLPTATTGMTQPLEEAAHRASSSGRILLADDSFINQEIAQAVLEAAGYKVDVVDDGAAAVHAVMIGDYDLVLMDVQMPVMDGVTATRRIRALHGPEREVPIIAMTANVLTEQVAGFLQAGMNGHVGKPFKRPELFAVVDHWLGKDQIRKAG